nr:hypothetical protein [Tanacetum cinerariifolium]
MMIEQRNELFKAMKSMFEEFRQREQTANLSTRTFEPSRRFNFICYDDDDDDDERTIPLRDIISQLPPSIVITTSPPVLLTFEDPEDFLIMGNEDLSTIPEKESDEFIKCRASFPSPIPYEDSDPLLEETDILLSHYDNSLPDYETFSFDIKEKSSGSTTTHSDYSHPDYEAFYFDDDHIEEKSSGSTTTHSDFSLLEYYSFIFDLLIDLFLTGDKSVSHHEEFADELTHIISSPDPELNDFPLLLSDYDSTFFEEFSEIDLLVSFSSGNKDKVFDPGISEKTFSPTYDCLDFEDSSARGFVLRSLELQSLAYGNPIS